jgi:hypothetical protein
LNRQQKYQDKQQNTQDNQQNTKDSKKKILSKIATLTQSVQTSVQHFLILTLTSTANAKKLRIAMDLLERTIFKTHISLTNCWNKTATKIICP